MPSFLFKFQPVLDLKTQIEDNLKNELSKAIQKLEYEKNILWKIEDDKKKYELNFTDKTEQGVAIEEIKEYTSYISFLSSKIVRQKENINSAQNYVDKYREELIKSSQEKEVLEKLKEKKFVEHLKEENKKEQKVIDEVISFKYNNRGLGY